MIRMIIPSANINFIGKNSRAFSRCVADVLPLLTHHRLEDTVASRGSDTFTVQDFLASVWSLAARLPARRYAFNLCTDRYHFLIAFAAALISRQVSLLPTCRAPEVLAQLNQQYPDAYILSDHDDIPSNIPSHLVSSGCRDCEGKTDIPTIPSEQIAAIVFTSGSSGLPRAHEKTWGSLVTGAHALKRRLSIQEECSQMVVGTVPAQHMYGLETTIMLPLQSGWGIHAGNPILPADIHEALEKMGCPVWLMTTPVHLRAYVAQQTHLPGLRRIISATMPLAQSLALEAEYLWHASVQEIYGCTEGGVIGSRQTTVTHVWTLCPGLRLWQEGDAAWVRGGHVGQPLRLADRITIQSPSQFLLHGPNYDLVKVAGKRTSLAALNATLANIQGVVDGTFYRPPHRKGNTDARLIAFVVAPGMRASTIQAELRKRIDPLFLPRPLYLVKALPRNLTGKLPRERLETFAAEIALRYRRHRG